MLLSILDNRLLDTTTQLKQENLRISVENEQLRTGGGTIGSDSAVHNHKISALEKKLLIQQEELTDLHKRKGENAQMIVDLNIKLEKQTKTLNEKEFR